MERHDKKIIEDYEKDKARTARLEKEAPVKALLIACGVWTSCSEFVKGGDAKELIRLNKVALKNLDGYGGSLKGDEAIAFLEHALDSIGAEAFNSA